MGNIGRIFAFTPNSARLPKRRQTRLRLMLRQKLLDGFVQNLFLRHAATLAERLDDLTFGFAESNLGCHIISSANFGLKRV